MNGNMMRVEIRDLNGNDTTTWKGTNLEIAVLELRKAEINDQKKQKLMLGRIEEEMSDDGTITYIVAEIRFHIGIQVTLR